MPKPTRNKQGGKVAKPHPDFPLTPGAKYWCKKVKRKMYYFGKVADDPTGDAALARWLAEKDDILAGRPARARIADTLTVKGLCDRFITHCDAKVATGELAQRTRKDYFKVCERIVKVFGRLTPVADLTPDDFARLRADMAKGNGPVTLSGLINRARVVINFAHRSALIKSPIQTGLAFDKPTEKTMREAREAAGERMIEAKDCRRLIEAAHTPELKAMILLGLNCGFGNTDCAKLPVSAVDLDKGWINFPRPKTAIKRRVPLWPETVAALREVLTRRTPGRELVFATKCGGKWADAAGGTTAVTHEFKKVLEKCKLYRRGQGFYTLRHIHRTVADGALDQVAANAIMGHAAPGKDMSARYRERIEDDRLRAVTTHIRDWLNPAQTQAAPALRIVG